MNQVTVVNIKCGGCEKNIMHSLEKLGCQNIKVDIAKQTITFEDGDLESVKKQLLKMGYPEAGTKEAESVLKKAKSFVSCAIGKMQK